MSERVRSHHLSEVRVNTLSEHLKGPPLKDHGVTTKRQLRDHKDQQEGPARRTSRSFTETSGKPR